MKNKNDFKVFMTPNWNPADEYYVGKMPETINLRSQPNLHLTKKTKNCYEIEDRQRFSPDFYEGYIQHQQQEGCKYLAFIKGRENFSIVPISDWVLFHKKNKMNEDEFNSKSLKIEEEMIKTTKGELSHKRYLRKQRDEKEDEEDNEEDNKSQKSQKKEKEAVDSNLPPKKLKRTRKELGDEGSAKSSESEDEEEEFFQKIQDYRQFEQVVKPKTIEQEQKEITSAVEKVADDSSSSSSSSFSNELLSENEFPELYEDS